MAYTTRGTTVSIPAGADLSAKQYYFVKMSDTNEVNLAGNGDRVLGVLLNKPESGETALVQVDGVATVLASGTITVATHQVASDADGKATPAVTTDYIAGEPLEDGADGQYVSVLLGHAPAIKA